MPVLLLLLLLLLLLAVASATVAADRLLVPGAWTPAPAPPSSAVVDAFGRSGSCSPAAASSLGTTLRLRLPAAGALAASDA
jgi:hypothetical protein